MKPSHLSFAQSQIALSIKVAAMLLITLAIYFQDLTLIANEALQSEIMSYMLAIPILFIYLIYRKRKMIRAAVSFERISPFRKSLYTGEIVGGLLCLTAFLLYWRGSYSFYPLEYHIVSLSLFAAGLILIIFNTKTLQVLAFPIAFLLFLTPLPSEIVSIAGANVAALSSQISYNILKSMGLPVTLTTEYGAPALVVTEPFGSSISFAISVASSGIYSTIGFSIFAIFLTYIARGPAWKRATLFFVSLPIIYALNVIRIIALVSIGHWQGVNIAWNVFHFFGGLVLILLGTIILVFLSEKIWKIQIFTKSKKTLCPNCDLSLRNSQNFCSACGKLLKNTNIKFSKLDLGKIVALAIFTTLIVTISMPVFAVFALTDESATILIQSPGNEQAATTQIFPEIPGCTLKFLYRDTKFEQIAPRDRALLYSYTPINASSKKIWIALEIGSSKSTWHSWEACLITWPQTHGLAPEATQLDLREVQLLQNPPLIAKFFAFESTDSNTTKVILYWYESALFSIGSSSEQKYVKISLAAYPKNKEDIPKTEDMLLSFGKAIANYWQPTKTWSQINLTLSQNGHLLITIPTTLLVIILIHQTIQKQKIKKSNLKIYNKLPPNEDKLILKAAHQAAEEDKPTTNVIASHYQKITGKKIELGSLTEKLTEAEKANLIEKDLTSQEDEAILIWHSQILL